MKRILSILSVLAAALAVSTPASAAPTPTRTAPVTGEYVALGDSYASGVGAGPYDPASGDCKQSPDSYPRTWARNHPGVAFKDMTCSGAKIDDVRARQLGALSTRTTLVTITVGGNDDGFTSTVENCLTGSDALCKYSTDLGSWYARNTLVDRLAALYSEVRALAPNARVFVMSYPRVIDEGTGSCGAITPNAFKRTQMNNNADHMAEGIRSATERAGVKFVEMRLPFLGHQACSAEPWINGVDATRISEIFHPNRYGYAVVYTFMLQMETDVH
ncbi:MULTISPECIES: SGNH/GDSL hydrolase family protein [Catenuloplanes]|uniref:Lysophospholipase L1-like esterase n=1 Tax=Catenuloplanes niger TaxID=587534 RepID=A0AAE3ZQL3_9ACTN|nr:SGNH/GDSL hydrolase family protein [Catenuloplanes niger]MDR7323761.1 lysophospholipase L1-like esterase [Catenuloplanes niger]